MSRYDRASMLYPMSTRERVRQRTWLTLLGVALCLLALGWVLVPTVVLAVLGLAVLGGGIAAGVKVHDLKAQQRANDAAQEIDRRLERDRWVIAVEHETEVAPLGADPSHCDDCRRANYAREQRLTHDLATTLGEECTCDVCTNKPWRLRGSCHHPAEHVIDVHDVKNEDGMIVRIDAFCQACGYTLKSDDV